ncbi:MULTISPECIES: hypothetical protein [Sorangium]|uniref:Uncharacterized protein n=1 Tax=Sorangium atrum TaxID=2995308 RepID=A0ABT5BZI7_9BACT|nr:hypothetical protein [Sorangium aterium]MDC0678366.1 hypothetical protein [Sorangium aterium]
MSTTPRSKKVNVPKPAASAHVCRHDPTPITRKISIPKPAASAHVCRHDPTPSKKTKI